MMFTKKTVLTYTAAVILTLSGVSAAEATILVAPGSYNSDFDATTRGTTIRIDQEASFDEAQVVEGTASEDGYYPLFAGQPGFDKSYGTRQLLGTPTYDRDGYMGVRLDGDNRTKIEYSYTSDSEVLTNGPGGDFAVFEAGNPNEPEMFGIAVTQNGIDYTDFRYEAWDDFRDQDNDNSGMLWTIFDLSDFGIGDDGSIMGIILTNLFVTDEVGSPDGEGVVTLGGITGGGFELNAGTNDSDYAVGDEGYRTFSSGDADPDIVFVGALAPISVPAPSSLALFSLALVLGLGGLALRRTS